MAKINDFGEKIGGARKDRWYSRGLSPEDLFDMNKLELQKFVIKQEVWKPDYNELNHSGYDRSTCYIIKKLYNAIQKTPTFNFNDDVPAIKDRCSKYILFIQDLKKIVQDNKDINDLSRELVEYLIKINYLTKLNDYRYKVTTTCARDNFIRIDKTIGYLLNPEYYQSICTTLMDREGFLVPKSKKLPRGYEIRFSKTDDRYNVYKNDGNHLVLVSTPERIREGEKLSSEEEAIRWAVAWQHDSRNRIIRYVPPTLNEIKRTGPQYSRIGRHATGKMIMDKFGFRAGEYGNWMTDADRQVSLNYAYDSFMDIARALNITYKDVGLDGQLAIAFGSRGVKRAAAHYEPARKVINLTKMHGAGSLGHEWWHSLDHHISYKLGYENKDASISSQAYKYEPMNNLIKTIQFGPDGKTAFYTASQEIDKEENRIYPYWSKKEEMCARAFACYIHDRLGYKNDYLTGHAYCSPAIPSKDDERERIYKCFDELFEALCRDNILTKDDHKIEKENEKAAEEQLQIVNNAAQEIVNLTFNYEKLETQYGNQISFEDLFSVMEKEPEEPKLEQSISDVDINYESPEPEDDIEL